MGRRSDTALRLEPGAEVRSIVVPSGVALRCVGAGGQTPAQLSARSVGRWRVDQPVPEVSQADVARIIARDFDPVGRERLTALLLDPELSLSPRVVLAVLKLSNRDVGAVTANLERARMDWRDVVACAEYPAYMKATSGSKHLDPARRSELIRADWAQYDSWLNRQARHREHDRPPAKARSIDEE